jgi:hypothetical protein
MRTEGHIDMTKIKSLFAIFRTLLKIVQECLQSQHYFFSLRCEETCVSLGQTDEIAGRLLKQKSCLKMSAYFVTSYKKTAFETAVKNC